MQNNPVDIVVIVLNYNSWQASKEYVLLLQNQQDVNLRFVLVDNCSPDGSYQHLASFFKTTENVEVIQSDYNGGYAYGNNFGLRYIQDKVDRETYILISNNDILVADENLLSSLCKSYKSCENIAFISPLMHIANKPAGNCAWKIPGLEYDIFTVVGFNRDKVNKSIYYTLPQQKSVMQVDCLTGAFFMGKLGTFSQLNYFDERTFLYEEERILGLKVKQAGMANYLALNLKFDHIHSAVIDEEINSFDRLKHLLHSRVVYHKYYAKTNLLSLSLLKFVYSSYLFLKHIQNKINQKHQ